MFSWASLYGECCLSVQFVFCQVYRAEDALHERALFFLSSPHRFVVRHSKTVRKVSIDAPWVEPQLLDWIAFMEGWKEWKVVSTWVLVFRQKQDKYVALPPPFYFWTEPESVIGSNVSCENTLIPEAVTRAGIWRSSCWPLAQYFTTTEVLLEEWLCS